MYAWQKLCLDGSSMVLEVKGNLAAQFDTIQMTLCEWFVYTFEMTKISNGTFCFAES